MKNHDYMHQVLDSLYFTLTSNINGDIAEFGTWKGGASLLVNAALRHIAPNTDRKYHLFDSFAGHPDYSKTKDKNFDMVEFSGALAVDVDSVKNLFRDFSFGPFIE